MNFFPPRLIPPPPHGGKMGGGDYRIPDLSWNHSVIKCSSLCTRFGQIVIGPPGSGKTTYVGHMADLLRGLGRQVAIVNLDPANEKVEYKPDIEVWFFITTPWVVLFCYSVGCKRILFTLF